MAFNRKQAFVERTEFLTSHEEDFYLFYLANQMYTHSLTVTTFPALSAITINIAIIACRRSFRESSRHLKTAVGSSEATTLHCLALNKTWPTTCLISHLYFVLKKTDSKSLYYLLFL